MQRIAQVEAEIDGLLARGATVGEMLEGRQGLLKGRSRLPQGRALDRLGPGLSAIGHGLGPDLATDGMMRQPFDLVWAQPEAPSARRLAYSPSRAVIMRTCSIRRRSCSRTS